MNQKNNGLLVAEHVDDPMLMLGPMEKQTPIKNREKGLEAEDNNMPATSTKEQWAFRIPLPALELIIGSMLLAAALFYLKEAYSLPEPFNPVDIGAGGFPKLLALVLLIFLAVMLVLAGYHLVIGGQYFSIVVAYRPIFVILATLLIIGQALLFEKLGVIACVGISSFLLMLIAGERRPAHFLGVPVALVGFIYVVFNFALNVNLP